jgi:hypothetical protein
MRHSLFVYLSILAAAVAGCEAREPAREIVVHSSAAVVESARYEDPLEQEQFVAALKQAGIPFVITQLRGKDYVKWDPNRESDVLRIQTALFGAELPDGRNLASSGPAQQEFKDWLAARQIPYTTQVSRGREYVVWDAQYTRQVSEWKYFPPTTGAAASNSSIERTATGKPASAAHVER